MKKEKSETAEKRKLHGLRIKNAETLQERIASSVILVVAIPMILLGIVSCWLNYSSTNASLEQSMTEMAKIVSGRVQWQQQAQKNIVWGMGTSYRLGSDEYSIQEKQDYIDQIVEEYGFLRGKFIGADGIAPIDGVDYNDREYFQIAIKGGAYFTEPLVSKADGKINLMVAAPVWKDGDVNSAIIGVVFVVLPTETLNEIVADVKISENAGAYILNKDGKTVAHTTTALVENQNNTIERAKSDSSLKAIAELETKMTKGEEGFGTYTYGGVTKFLAYSPIQDTDGWSVGVMAPIEDFFSDTIIGIVITAILVVITLIVASIIARKMGAGIGIPIRKCVQRIELLVNGDITSQVPVFSSKDEVGLLGNATKEVVDEFNGIIEDISYLLEGLAKGDFTVESQAAENYCGDFKVILEALDTTLGNLDSTMKQINQGAEQVAAGAEQMAGNAQSLAEGATEQAGAVEELTATVENVNDMAKRGVEVSTTSAELTRQSAKEAQDGQKSIQELIVAMENIMNVSMEIQKIIGTIEDIASQTNLLSLNASIEAARAGESGRGFAVVADQIGKLAADSAQSAVETRELVVKALDEVQKGNAITQTTAEVLEKVIKNMSEFATMAQGSSDSSSAQAEMLNQVLEGIQQIAGVVQSNSAAAEESSATSEELSAQSENLKSLVDQFHLKA